MIELKQQLPILTYPNGLTTFVADQTTRRARVNTLITNATSAVEKARKEAVLDTSGIGESRQVGGSTVKMLTPADKQAIASIRTLSQKQVVRAVSDIRTALDKECIPVLRAMATASEQAKEYAARHYDKYSVLRRARGTVNGLLEATQMRAFYAEILEDIEPRELAAFAQQAIDQGDPILADAVQRENFTRPRDSRAFMNQTFMALVPNAEFDDAQAKLALVVQLHEAATVEYATFGREIGAVSLARMSYGLNYADVKLNKDGSIDPQGAE